MGSLQGRPRIDDRASNSMRSEHEMRRTAITLFIVAALAALTSASSLRAAEGTVADAAMRGDRGVVLSLIKQGADVNAPQGDGVTALHWAARNGDADLVAALGKAGANPRANPRLGSYAPLHLAAERGAAAAITALVGAGAPVDARTSTGATPLMFAASAGDTAAIAALLDRGADVNAKETDRWQTPLMFAAANNGIDAVKLLLARGANPNAATKPTDLGALSANGADPDGRNLAGKPETRRGPARVLVPGVQRQHLFNEQVAWQGGLTPLLFAARQGYSDVAAALLIAGVDVNQRKGGDDA